MTDYKNWLEEVWAIKSKIANETKKMSFNQYLKYLKNLDQKAEKKIKIQEKIAKN